MNDVFEDNELFSVVKKIRKIVLGAVHNEIESMKTEVNKAV